MTEYRMVIMSLFVMWKKLLQWEWIVNIHHVYKEANQAAYFMAYFAVGLAIRCHVLV